MTNELIKINENNSKDTLISIDKELFSLTKAIKTNEDHLIKTSGLIGQKVGFDKFIPGQKYSRATLLSLACDEFSIIPKIEFEIDESFIIQAIKGNSRSRDDFLRYVPFQTEKMCIAAVNKNCMNYVHVHDKTNEIVTLFVKANGSNLAAIKKQTEQLCVDAVNSNVKAFAHVREQTPKIIDAAFNSCGTDVSFIQHIEDMNEECAMRAIDVDPSAIWYISNPSEKLVYYAAQFDPKIISQLPYFQTKDIVLSVLQRDPTSICHVRPGILEDSFYEDLVQKDGLALKDIKQRTPEIELIAVQQNWRALAFVSYYTEEICIAAYEQDVRALRFIWKEYGFNFENSQPLNRIYSYLKSLEYLDKDPYRYIAELNSLDVQRKLEFSLYGNLNNSNNEKRSVIKPQSRKKIGSSL